MIEGVQFEDGIQSNAMPELAYTTCWAYLRQARTIAVERTTGILSPTMGVISTEMYEALLLAHVPEDKARAAAAAVAKTQDLASKSDLLQLQAELEKRFAEVEKSLAVVKFAVFSGGSIILVLLIKLVFFP